MSITKISAAMTDLDGAVTINESSADADFRVESDGNANMLFVDGGNDRVGVGTSPDYTMHIFTSDSGASAHGNSDDLFIENSGNAGITIGSGTTSNGSIFFSDSDSSLSGQIEYRHNGDSLYIYTGAASRLRIDSDGLKFGNDTATANALDDYEEGTYTPTYLGATTSGTQAYSHQNGFYIKVGDLVTVFLDFNVSSSSGMAGAPYISLPFQAKNHNWYAPFIPWEVATNFSDSDQRAAGYVAPNSTVVVGHKYTAGNSVIESGYMNINTTGRISGQVTYQVA